MSQKITFLAIAEQLKKKLETLFPEIPVNLQKLPDNAPFPAILIEHSKTEATDLNRSTIALTSYFKITCYGSEDPVAENSIDAQDIQSVAFYEFAQGGLLVGDRVLRLRADAGGKNGNEAVVNLRIDYYVERRMSRTTETINEIHVQTNP